MIKGAKLRYGQISCGCIKSKGEFKINQLLSENNINYKTQIKFMDCKDTDLLPFDFGVYNKDNKLLYLIEFDGVQHYKRKNNWFQEDEDYNKLQAHDKIKDEYCEKNNIPLIRIPYWKYDDLTIEDLILKEK